MVSDLGCKSLTEIRELIGDCQRCSLAATRTCIVFGEGDRNARVVLVGEAPGRNEDLSGQPFVGAAGRLLDELLEHAGLRRDEIFIANVLKCRPPNNRDPLTEEIETCTPFLREQIRVIDPTVVVTLGNFATRFMLGTEAGITTLHGRACDVDGRTVLPVFHPAAAIYDRSKRAAMFHDFAELARILRESPVVAHTQPESPHTGAIG